jgi:hypothetical protein
MTSHRRSSPCTSQRKFLRQFLRQGFLSSPYSSTLCLFFRQAQCRCWRSLKWNIADLLTSQSSSNAQWFGGSKSVQQIKFINFWFFKFLFVPRWAKGQITSKALFGILGFFQKTNEQICFLVLLGKTTEFVRSFFGRIRGYQKLFWNYLTFNIMPHHNSSHFDTLGHDYW